MYIFEEQKGGDKKVKVAKKDGWREIRDTLAASLVNGGDPYLVCTDIDFEKRQELYLKHEFDGRELDRDYVLKNLPYIHSLWRRPVHLETMVDGKKRVYTYDGIPPKPFMPTK